MFLEVIFAPKVSFDNYFYTLFSGIIEEKTHKTLRH